jgi:K+-sensing histidine kinase KdpD
MHTSGTLFPGVTKLPVDGTSLAIAPETTEKPDTGGGKMNQSNPSERFPGAAREPGGDWPATPGAVERDDPGRSASRLFFGLEQIFSLVIHSGKNHLGPIKGYASLIQDDNDDKSNSRRWADKIVRNVNRMESYFELLDMYRIRGAIGIKKASWQQIVSVVMERFAAVNVKGVPIEISNNAAGPFVQHRDLITRVMVHLVLNAYESIEKTGKLAIDIEERGFTSDGRRRFEVRVSDTGCGIAREDSNAIWKPFFSTKHDHIGLGLSFVAAAAPSLGMKVAIDSAVGRGTTVGLVLSEQGGQVEKENPGS